MTSKRQRPYCVSSTDHVTALLSDLHHPQTPSPPLQPTPASLSRHLSTLVTSPSSPFQSTQFIPTVSHVAVASLPLTSEYLFSPKIMPETVPISSALPAIHEERQSRVLATNFRVRSYGLENCQFCESPVYLVVTGIP